MLVDECPKCGGNTNVVDVRSRLKGVTRRRECKECEYRYTTIERLEVKVIKKSKYACTREDIYSNDYKAKCNNYRKTDAGCNAKRYCKYKTERSKLNAK